jgi:hypothetical protein
MNTSGRAALLAALMVAGMVTLGVGAATAAPECDDPVATALHEAHETSGPAGEPLHDLERAYCDSTP